MATEISSELAELLQDGPILDVSCKREVANSVLHIIEAVGEDSDREGLWKTPERVARMYDEILAGYAVDPQALLNEALFEVEYRQMVVVSHIESYSLCEHHMLPIIGEAHVAYVPDTRVVGLSKIPRVVEAYARRLQMQERMTRQIAELVAELVQPQGVGVVIEGLHLCVAMRGAKKASARMRTTALMGSFEADARTRAEFLQSIED